MNAAAAEKQLLSNDPEEIGNRKCVFVRRRCFNLGITFQVCMSERVCKFYSSKYITDLTLAVNGIECDVFLMICF